MSYKKNPTQAKKLKCRSMSQEGMNTTPLNCSDLALYFSSALNEWKCVARRSLLGNGRKINEDFLSK